MWIQCTKQSRMIDAWSAAHYAVGYSNGALAGWSISTRDLSSFLVSLCSGAVCEPLATNCKGRFPTRYDCNSELGEPHYTRSLSVTGERRVRLKKARHARPAHIKTRMQVCITTLAAHISLLLTRRETACPTSGLAATPTHHDLYTSWPPHTS